MRRFVFVLFAASAFSMNSSDPEPSSPPLAPRLDGQTMSEAVLAVLAALAPLELAPPPIAPLGPESSYLAYQAGSSGDF